MRMPSGGRLPALLAATVIMTCSAATPPPPVQPDLPQPGKHREFTLSIGYDAAGAAAKRFVLLGCSPPRGTHPKAAAACATLAKVGGDLSALEPDQDAMCTKEFMPVTITANGVWDGKFSWFERTYGNACEMRSMMGPVFDF
ncbi:hypothetical protein Aple_030610 [Acrocarpospora pleiomorpha]|uniref:Subtilisin inhibitor domain-containing protein n=1 Tax=Acrocarpospora pleiomorpha TaxID=90975 RepID=A0A5M3XEY6_9ACTN|nr:SSI family serine proteinase inhibitor [Acrocarpospora pleiomorpha]GES20165.1 hypothetical protein Aple_030610 [Acrocarpospora pleiomorpha]